MDIMENGLTSADYTAIFEAVGWNPPPHRQIDKALKGSLFTVLIKVDGNPAAMGRVFGDGALSYYIKDVAVVPHMQGKGLGTLVMERLLDYIKTSTPSGYGISIELMSTLGKEPFYEKLGFFRRPTDKSGCGMCRYGW